MNKMKDSFANGGVPQKSIEMNPLRLNDSSLKRRKKIILNGWLAAILYLFSDFLTISFTLLLSYTLYRLLEIGNKAIYQEMDIISAILSVALSAVFILYLFGGYEKESSVLNAAEIKNVVLGFTITFVLFVFITLFTKLPVSRYLMVLAYGFTLFALIIERTFIYHVFSSTNVFKTLNKKVVIYGAGELGIALYRSLVNSPKLGITPVGFIDDNIDAGHVCYPNGFNCQTGLPVLGTGEEIIGLTGKIHFDEVIVAIPKIDRQPLLDTLLRLKDNNIRISFVPNLYQIFLKKIHVQKIGNIPIFSEYEDDRNGVYLIIKQSFDILLSGILLLILSPVFVILAVVIKLDSKGPVSFKQDRIGKNGKVFTIYKFRSMVTSADPYEINPVDAEDERITRFGRFLRRTSLDELPQLINVLKGDMSLVGPRPEMPFIVSKYTHIHRERLKILPGITGLWQLSGDRTKAIHENMEYDLYYKNNMSFFLDVAILLETLIFAFRGI